MRLRSYRLPVNGTIVAVAGEGFLTRVGFSMVSFALPLYAISLGMNIGEIGLLFAFRTVATVAVKPLVGVAADRWGRKRTLVAAVVLRCIVGALLPFASLPWHLFAIRILQGVVTAAREPSAAALIATHGDRRSTASAFAWYTSARDMGRSIGYAVAGLLLTAHGSYQVVFVGAFLSSCVALVTVLRYVREEPDEQESAAQEDAHPATAPARALPLGVLVGYAFFGASVAGSAEMMQGMFPVIATQYAHLTESQAGLVVSFAAIAALIAGPSFGWLSDNVSRSLALSARSVANTVASLLYLAFPSFGGFLVARLVDDSGKAAFRPTWGAMLAEVSNANPARRARVISLIDSAYTVGEVLAPAAAGALLAFTGVPGMLGVRAALAIATEAEALWLFRWPAAAPSRSTLLAHAAPVDGPTGARPRG